MKNDSVHIEGYSHIKGGARDKRPRVAVEADCIMMELYADSSVDVTGF